MTSFGEAARQARGAKGAPRATGPRVCWLPSAVELQPLLWGSCQSSLSAGKEGRGSFLFPDSPILPGGDLAPQEVESSTIAGWHPAPWWDRSSFLGRLNLGTGVGSAASHVGKCQWLHLAPALCCCCSSAPLSCQAWGMSPVGSAGSQPGSPLPRHSSATAPRACVAVKLALKLMAWTSSVPEAVGREVVAAAGPGTILVRILRGRSCLCLIQELRRWLSSPRGKCELAWR